MVDQPKRPPVVGITSNPNQIKQQAAQPKPQVDPVIAAERRASYNQGKHDKGMQNLWTGAGIMLLAQILCSVFIFALDASNRERNMIESRVAVGAAISNAKLLNDDERHPVVEPGK